MYLIPTPVIDPLNDDVIIEEFTLKHPLIEPVIFRIEPVPYIDTFGV